MFHLPTVRRACALAAVSVLAAGGMTGCSSATGSSGDDALTVAGPDRITGLDPSGPLAADGGTRFAAEQIFGNLVVRDDTEFVPGLAIGWNSSTDHKIWTLQLRKTLRFSDGTRLTSKDVKASVAREVELGGPLAILWKGITVTTPSPTSVVFTSKSAQGSMLSKLSTVSVLPAGEMDQKGFFAKPVGAGPFEVESFTPGQSLTLVPNKDYWDQQPALAQLTIKYIGNDSARMTALKTGAIQATWALPDDQVAQLKGDNDIQTSTVTSDAQYTMWFNSSRPAFQQTAVRRAMWQAVDFPSILKSLYPVTGTEARAPIASTISGYAAQDPYTYDPEAAEAALQAAGFDFDKTYQLAYSGDEFTKFAQAVASYYARIGVKVVPTDKKKAAYQSDLLALNWDIDLQSLSDTTGDADYVLGRLYTCAAKRTGYCNHTLDSDLAQAASTINGDRRDAMYAKAEQIIWDDAVGMYPMDVRISYAWRSSVEGLTPSSNHQPDFSTVKVL